LSVRIRIHPLLQDLANGLEVVEVEGENVGKCLANLNRQFPGMRENIFDKHNKLLKHIEIFVNGRITSLEKLAAPVNDGDELSILMLLSGG
jgi:MoaD family protein